MQLPRASGILLHPTSLPGPYGIGDLGEAAYRFADFLVAARQRWWQVLPLGPTGYGDSPYQCFSAFAGNPLLISPQHLVRDGLLQPDDLQGVPGFPAASVDYGSVIAWKRKLLHAAAQNLQSGGRHPLLDEYRAFCQREAAWLADYSLFMALKDAHGGRVWSEWEPEVARRRPAALVKWRQQLAVQMETHGIAQFLFFRQWQALRDYAAQRGVQFIGDVPIFVAYDSSDVWARPELFTLDTTGRPTVVAGVPPDYFSATGQLWGNPLYRWDVIAQRHFDWWIERVKASLRLVDVLRIDHFIGFTRYWEVPAAETTAVRGRYVAGPGAQFLQALRDALGPLPLIAEDLGVVTPAVEALRDEFALPGMKILQFAFGAEPSDRFLPHNFTRNFVVYTGTHDNDTTVGWFHTCPPAERQAAQRYLARHGDDIAWDLIRLGMACVADTFIAPLQDILALGTEARMNFPGKPAGNWRWRYVEGQVNEQHVQRLRELVVVYERAGTETQG